MKNALPQWLIVSTLLMSCTGITTPPSSYDSTTPEAYLKSLEAKWSELGKTDLADFAPEIFQAEDENLSRIRQAYDSTKELTNEILDKSAASINQYEKNTTAMQKAMGKSYALRNAVHQLNFIRSSNPHEYYKAETAFSAAMKLARNGQLDKATTASKTLERQYEAMIKTAQQEAKKKYEDGLLKQQAAIQSDLNALRADPGSPDQLDETDNVIYRINLGNFAWNNSTLGTLDGTLEPPYVPPFPPPAGPNPPSGIGLDRITENAVRVSFTDVSDNETGNRILRTTDLLNWEVVNEAGPVTKFETHIYTDNNLQPETRYCYQIETHNSEGARRSQLRCAYTLDTNHIKLWRLQLRVRIANMKDAGADNPLRVIVRTNGEFFATETFLDYGHDDFERNSDFTYDLNLDNIEELSQIVGLHIINHGQEQDYMYIRELDLLANGKEIFSRVFGNTGSSVLKLGYYGNVEFDHSELRNHPSWQNFIARSVSDPSFNLPEIGISETNMFQAVISNEEIVSRIESLMGHLMSSDPAFKGTFQWGEISGAPVEVTRLGAKKIHVDLDVEAIVGWWPNPEVDIDFDIAFSKTCDPATNRMTITMQSENFTSNADYPLWKDILSLGTTKLTADVIDWYAENCTTPPSILRDFSVDLPPSFNCADLDINVDTDGNLQICCFSIFN